jgi:hypothetical protein
MVIAVQNGWMVEIVGKPPIPWPDELSYYPQGIPLQEIFSHTVEPQHLLSNRETTISFIIKGNHSIFYTGKLLYNIFYHKGLPQHVLYRKTTISFIIKGNHSIFYTGKPQYLLS